MHLHINLVNKHEKGTVGHSTTAEKNEVVIIMTGAGCILGAQETS